MDNTIVDTNGVTEVFHAEEKSSRIIVAPDEIQMIREAHQEIEASFLEAGRAYCERNQWEKIAQECSAKVDLATREFEKTKNRLARKYGFTGPCVIDIQSGEIRSQA